ncbi:hypothetical protein BFJ67_g10134 [Fusarium oxysporum f. sp. cepae]|nr:hypothetical protein BFJ67_g10134 [Fusarium oxysporum f. sp. cepae]
MATPKSIALMITSTCEARIGPSVAALVKSIVENHSDPSGTSLTLAQFQHEHSKAWSAKIKKHDGYVLAIPEYNYSLSGGTKNAIDYLMNEWKGKPVAVIGYGIHGGKHASTSPMRSCLRWVSVLPQLDLNWVSMTAQDRICSSPWLEN